MSAIVIADGGQLVARAVVLLGEEQQRERAEDRQRVAEAHDAAQARRLEPPVGIREQHVDEDRRVELESSTPIVNSHDEFAAVSAPRNQAKPTAVISTPKRLSGRRHQA